MNFEIHILMYTDCTGGTVGTNEYISVIEGTAPAIVLQTFDSLNLSPPALSDGQVVQYTADRARRGWLRQMFARRWVLYLIAMIYILWVAPSEISSIDKLVHWDIHYTVHELSATDPHFTLESYAQRCWDDLI